MERSALFPVSFYPFRRRREIPDMAVEVARAIAAPVGQILGRLVNPRARGPRALEMSVDIGEIDEYRLRDGKVPTGVRRVASRALAQHDAPSVQCHLAMHPAPGGRFAHFLFEPECARQPIQGGRDGDVVNVGNDLGFDIRRTRFHRTSPFGSFEAKLARRRMTVLNDCYHPDQSTNPPSSGNARRQKASGGQSAKAVKSRDKCA